MGASGMKKIFFVEDSIIGVFLQHTRTDNEDVPGKMIRAQMTERRMFYDTEELV
jgi:hypothetical protein